MRSGVLFRQNGVEVSAEAMLSSIYLKPATWHQLADTSGRVFFIRSDDLIALEAHPVADPP